jgi:hypothetical protein
MKKFQFLFPSKRVFQKAALYLAATTTVGLLALLGKSSLSSARADLAPANAALTELRELYQEAQLAELHQLEEAFHHAGSYGGNLDEMMSLWADGSTLTAGTNTYSGKDAIRAFFAAAGPFNHNWVGLTKAFVFTAAFEGDSAELSFQCDYVDPSVTPAVVRVNSILSGTVKKIQGQWLFWDMTATPTPL